MSGPGDSRALLQSARKARPSAEARQRMRAGIGRKVALAAAAGASAASATTGAAAAGAGSAVASKVGLFGFLAKVGLAVALLGVTGVGVHAWLDGGTAVSVAPPPAAMAPSSPIESAEAPLEGAAPETPGSAPSAPVDERAVEEATSETPTPSASTAPHAASSPSSRASAARRDAASIAAEVALLRKAQSALRDGDGDASLKALDAMASKHPSGAMREERDAARVVALCAAGRVDEARREGLQFLAQWPTSLQAPRVRASCAFAPPTAQQR